jgi:LPXTG-site transpeptidase (sortase) family protein
MNDGGQRERRARRTVSTLLIAGGVLALVVSGTSIARAAIARDTARSHWAELEAGRAVAGARLRVAGTGGWTTARGTPVARLVIPRLGLDEVVVEGVSDADLRAGPGHMTGSALPGDSGNAVISAHRDRHFHPLARIVVGDTIVTESDHGTVTWAVARLRVVDADAPALRASTSPLLTLTTCWPIRFFGPAPERLIVEATRVGGSR